MQLSEQEVIRREKLDKLKEMGINPYPAALYPVTHRADAIENDYEEVEAIDLSKFIFEITKDMDLFQVLIW